MDREHTPLPQQEERPTSGTKTREEALARLAEMRNETAKRLGRPAIPGAVFDGSHILVTRGDIERDGRKPDQDEVVNFDN
jgi:hypothetical protein